MRPLRVMLAPAFLGSFSILDILRTTLDKVVNLPEQPLPLEKEETLLGPGIAKAADGGVHCACLRSWARPRRVPFCLLVSQSRESRRDAETPSEMSEGSQRAGCSLSCSDVHVVRELLLL